MKEQKTEVKSKTGLSRNTAAALCYAAGWISGLIFLLVEKKDEFVRFHAMQSVITFGGLTVLAMVPVVGWILSPFAMIAGFILWLVLIVKAYQGENFELPYIGKFAKKQLGKMK